MNGSVGFAIFIITNRKENECKRPEEDTNH